MENDLFYALLRYAEEIAYLSLMKSIGVLVYQVEHARPIHVRRTLEPMPGVDLRIATETGYFENKKMMTTPDPWTRANLPDAVTTTSRKSGQEGIGTSRNHPLWEVVRG